MATPFGEFDVGMIPQDVDIVITDVSGFIDTNLLGANLWCSDDNVVSARSWSRPPGTGLYVNWQRE